MPCPLTYSGATICSDVGQLRELDMPAIGQTKKDPPLDELLDRLAELMKHLPGSDLRGSMLLSPAPAESTIDDSAQRPIDRPAERELLEKLEETLRRVEAAQVHAVADLRREIVQTFGQLILALERAGELSDSSIQRLQVALGVAAHEGAERRILSELALLRADLQRPSEGPIEKRRGIGLVTLGIGIFLFGVGIAAGVLVAPTIVSWLHWALGLVF